MKPRYHLDAWAIYCWEVSVGESYGYLSGRSGEDRPRRGIFLGKWMHTSNVIQFAWDRGFAETRNSIYVLGSPSVAYMEFIKGTKSPHRAAIMGMYSETATVLDSENTPTWFGNPYATPEKITEDSS